MKAITLKQALLRLLISRRFSISALAIGSLTLIALKNKIDTSIAIASTAAALAAANSFQKKTPPQPVSQDRNAAGEP